MRKDLCIILPVCIITLLIYNVRSEVILNISPATLCLGTTDNTINFSMTNLTDPVCGLRADILFDTDCFTVTGVERTVRNITFGIFVSAPIDGGIRIVMLSNQQITPGTGSIAEITVDVNGNCPEGEYVWDVVEAEVGDQDGRGLPVTEVQEKITVLGCTMCTLVLSSTEFDLGEILVGHEKSSVLTITNIGFVPGNGVLTTEGCAGVHQTYFMLEVGSSQDVTIFCRPEKEGRCEGKVTISGDCGEEEILVTCRGISVEVSINDRAVLQNSRGNRITLTLENVVPIAAYQTDVLFDTTCFEVVAAERTGRNPIDIFNWSQINGGIRILNAGVGTVLPEGNHVVAEIFANVSNCPEGDYQWDVCNAIAADPRVCCPPLIKENDGTITILIGTKGDINNDGVINSLDVVQGVRIITGLSTNPSSREQESADCNGDDEVDVSDILSIVNMITGLGTCPP